MELKCTSWSSLGQGIVARETGTIDHCQKPAVPRPGFLPEEQEKMLEHHNEINVMFVWNWPTWNIAIYRTARSTTPTDRLDDQDCWFSNFSTIGIARRPKIAIVPGVNQLFRSRSSKNKESKILKFTESYNGARFKSSVARVLASLIHGPPVESGPDPDQCSHLCINETQKCLNPFHTCWEGDQKNKSRNGCVNSHAMYCVHDPKCAFTDYNGLYLPHRNPHIWVPCDCENYNCHTARTRQAPAPGSSVFPPEGLL